MAEEVNKQAEKLAKTIEDLRESKAVNAQAIADLKSGMDAMRQAQIESKMHRPAGKDDAVSKYIVTDDERKRVGGDDIYTGKNGESIVMRSYTDREGVRHKGLLDDLTPDSPWQMELQKLATKRAIVRWQMRSATGRARTPTLDYALEQHIKRGPDAVSKLFADSAGIGQEWIFETETPELARKLELNQRLAGLFETIQVPAGGTFRVPFLNRGLRPYIKAKATVTDPAKYTASDLNTERRTYDPQSVAIRFQLDDDAAEDSLVAAYSLGLQELVNAVVDMADDCIINGDETAAHQDDIANWDIRGRWGASGLGTAADHRRLVTGLRAQAFDRSTATDQSANEGSTAAFRNAWTDMTSPHALQGAVCIMTPEFFLKTALGWSDFITWDKAGPAASILNGTFGLDAGPLPGQVGFLYGVPVIINWFASADLNASGVYDNVTTTKGSMIFVSTSRYKQFVKGSGLRIESARDITRGVTDQVLTHRWHFDTLDDATEKNVSLAYNLTTT